MVQGRTGYKTKDVIQFLAVLCLLSYCAIMLDEPHNLSMNYDPAKVES